MLTRTHNRSFLSSRQVSTPVPVLHSNHSTQTDTNNSTLHQTPISLTVDHPNTQILKSNVAESSSQNQIETQHSSENNEDIDSDNISTDSTQFFSDTSSLDSSSGNLNLK